MALSTLLGCLAPTVARAADSAADPFGPVRIEQHVGSNDPFGLFGLALVYDPNGTFSGGLGARLTRIKKSELPALGLFGRMRLLRFAWGSLGVGLALSRENLYDDRLSMGYSFARRWVPAYRASGTVGIEFAAHAWSLRFDAGLGYLLNGGSCSAQDNTTAGSSWLDCDSPTIPAAVRDAGSYSRLVPSLTATVGYRFAKARWPESAPVGAPSGYKAPDTALHLSLWPTVVPVLGGTAVILASVARNNDIGLAIVGIATAAAGVSFGPSIGLAYADRAGRAWGRGALRLLGIAAGCYVYVEARRVNSHDSPTAANGDPDGEALGIVLITAALVSAISDVSTAPEAARQTNARNGFAALSLAPTALRSPVGASPGLAVLGMF